RVLLQLTPLAFAKLPDRDRFVLQAVEVDRRPYREIEQELGLRSGALKMIVHRARARFQAHLAHLVS
ncbi:MAG: sigma-70 family RNA polymerase sigma factor, partial [Planctomycetes bacterium]|nr:sigma-70 family RNA polymerase sigma factor [Planctomycetota bacterium]